MVWDDAGERYVVHQTGSDYSLKQKLGDLTAGTELEQLLPPKDDYVMGIYDSGTPLLSWQAAQEELREKNRGVWMGIGLKSLGVSTVPQKKFLKKKKIMLDKMGTAWYYNGANWLTANRKLVLIVVRVHLFPSRTQKLSSLTPTIVAW